MTSRERAEAALRFEEPDRVPFNFWLDECSNRSVPKPFAERLGENFRLDHYGVDVIEAFTDVEWPHSRGVVGDGRDWALSSVSLTLDDLLGSSWPEVTDKTILPICQTLERYPDKAIFVLVCGVLTILHGARTYGIQMMDMYDNSSKLRRVYDRISTITTKITKAVCGLGISAVYFGEDIASTGGLMISPEMLDEYVWPYNGRPIYEAQQQGVPVIYHSDGNTMGILDRLVGLGIRGVSPVQPHLNDLAEMKRKYHGRLAVYGGLDNTFAIPRGSCQQVREQVRSAFRVLGQGGGLIFSCGAIPYTAPPENIEAMVAAIKEECIYP